MARLREISNGQISGTGTLTCKSEIIGGFFLDANGSATATIVLRKDNSGGEVIVDYSSTSPLSVFAPFEAAQTVYYSVTGTGASAEIFEWQQKVS